MTWKKCGCGPTSTIGRDFHCLPSFEELLLKNNLGLLEILDVGIRGWGLGIEGGGEQGHTGMETVVGEERGESGSGVFGIVVAELRQREEAGPVGLLVVTVDPKILLQDGIEALCLAVRLRMEGGGPVGVDAQKFQKTFPKVGSEDGIAIADEAGRKAVESDDVLKEQRCHVRCRHRFGSRDEDRLFREPVHNDQDCIVIVAWR